MSEMWGIIFKIGGGKRFPQWSSWQAATMGELDSASRE